MAKVEDKYLKFKSVYKWFWMWQDDRYEAWLAEMSRRGWHLAGVDYYPGIRFHFTKGEPKEYIYKVDYKNTPDSDMDEYIELFANAGWEYIAKDIAWKYFRKEASDGQEDDIYSDANSKIQKFSNIRKLFGSVLALEGVCLANMIITTAILYREYGSINPLIAFFVIFILAFIPLLSYGMFKIGKRIKQLKNPIG